MKRLMLSLALLAFPSVASAQFTYGTYKPPAPDFPATATPPKATVCPPMPQAQQPQVQFYYLPQTTGYYPAPMVYYTAPPTQTYYYIPPTPQLYYVPTTPLYYYTPMYR